VSMTSQIKQSNISGIMFLLEFLAIGRYFCFRFC